MRFPLFVVYALLFVGGFGCKPQVQAPPNVVGTFRSRVPAPIDGHYVSFKFKPDGMMEMVKIDKAGNRLGGNAARFRFGQTGTKIVAERIEPLDATKMHLPITFTYLNEFELFVDGTKEVVTRIAPN